MMTNNRSSALKKKIIGLSEFKLRTLDRFQEIADFWDIIEDFIINSGCKKCDYFDIVIT